MSDIIKLLPDSVANQIAAGEVIQRPASVVKELVENAVDAGASAVTIVVKDAGRTLIQVIDNGRGMSDTDARMAFERHATSKISAADDLFGLTTMGFRGEALASICAVARVEVRTKTKDAAVGTRLVINGSEVESQKPESAATGTNMQVKNLFYNVPARRKFLKKDAVEMAAITREFERLALVNTGIDFTLIHNDVTIFSLRRSTELRRIADLFGKNLDKQLIPVEASTSLVELRGFVGLPEYARRRNPLQYLTVNGRNMRHPVFHKAVLECYEGLLGPDVQPNYFIDFKVDPSTIDVNIHPTKNEIKFENELAIRQILVAAIKESLGRFNAVPSIDFEAADVPDIPAFASKPVAPCADNPFAATEPPRVPDRPVARETENWDRFYDAFNSRRADALDSATGSSMNTREVSFEPARKVLQSELELDGAAPASTAMQIKNRYIVMAARDGIMVIDQHRAHERVLFDRYMKRPDEGQAGSQRVIFPATISLSPSQSALLSSLRPEIEKWGFDLAPMGQGTWSINGLPPNVNETSAAEIITAMLESAAEQGSLPTDEMRRKMAMAMAATASVKAGQPLNPEEIDRITGELLALDHPALTADGRRTFLIIPFDQITRMLQ